MAQAKFVQKTLLTSSPPFDGVGGASFGVSAAALASFFAFLAALRAALSSAGAAPLAASAALRFFSFLAAFRAAFSSAGDRGGVASPCALAASFAAFAAFFAFFAAFSSGVFPIVVQWCAVWCCLRRLGRAGQLDLLSK